MEYTEEQIERITEFASKPGNLEPAGPDARDNGRRMARAIADTFSEHDWATLLNRLSADRAAQQIAQRPAEEREVLLSLLGTERRTDVEAHLPVTV
ncbi:MAG: hypothetical protein OXF41_06625 [bacterium]|nr:hypothetical protein [bacterium]